MTRATRAYVFLLFLLHFSLCLAILGCSTFRLFSFPPPLTSPDLLSDSSPPFASPQHICCAMYTIQWEKNGSNGRKQDVPEDAVVESDRAHGVGDSICVEWGSRLWNAVVLEKRPAPTPLDLALPAKRNRKAPPCKLLEITCK